MKVRVWIWKHLTLKSIHWYYSKRIQPPVFGVWYVSHQIFACSFTSIELLSRQGRVTTSLLLVNSTTKNISEYLLDAETTTVKSIVSSKLPDVFLNENTRMNLDQFLKWFWKYKAAFPAIYLLLSAGLTVGVSTATCEASFSSVVRILTPYRRCMTHDRTGA